MTVYIYVVGAGFSKKDSIVILCEVIRFTGLYFHKIKLCCKVGFRSILDGILFVVLPYAAVVVRRHGRPWTLYMTVKPQAVRSVMTYPEDFILQIDVHLHDQRQQSWFELVQLVDYLYNFYKYFLWQRT